MAFVRPPGTRSNALCFALLQAEESERQLRRIQERLRKEEQRTIAGRL